MYKCVNPKIIALCGPASSGKSSVQAILESEFGVEPHDDSRILRRAAMAIYGFTEEMVTTQEGKSQIVTVGSETNTVRHFLGMLGLAIEKRHGSNFFTWRALQELKERYGENLENGPSISFGSARRTQPSFLREQGALVVEVRRVGVPLTNNSYDTYDADAAHLTILNPGTTIEELTNLTRLALRDYLQPAKEIA